MRRVPECYRHFPSLVAVELRDVRWSHFDTPDPVVGGVDRGNFFPFGWYDSVDGGIGNRTSSIATNTLIGTTISDQPGSVP